jgi:hypothetical protein
MLKLAQILSSTRTAWYGNPFPRAGVALLLTCCLALSGCAGPRTSANGQLPGWSRSVDALCRQVLESVARNDRAGLEALGISEPEYLRYVWPGLPVSKVPQWQAHAGFVWNQHRMKSLDGLGSVLARSGGTTYEFVRVNFNSAATKYETCTIHSDARLTVRHEKGQEAEIAFFSSIVETDGRYKVFSYARH